MCTRISLRMYVANVSASVAGVNNSRRKQHDLRVGIAMKKEEKNKLTESKNIRYHFVNNNRFHVYLLSSAIFTCACAAE